MNKKTVLIVEDEAIVAADLAARLGQLGYEVVGTEAKGEDAVEAAVRLRPRVVLMDIRLKGPMDGIEAAEAIRQRVDVPVIYLTAHSDSATLERAKLSDPFGYILKPFEERELTTNLEMALHKHDSDSEKRRSHEIMRNALAELELRTAEIRTANEALRASRVAALNLMEDAVLARKKAEETSAELRNEIAERRQAEEALRLSEEKFSLAFANNPAAIAMTRLEDGLFLDVNDTWLALNGYSRDEVIGRSARRLPIWPSAEAAVRFVQDLRERGIVRGWEQEFLRKSGEVFVAQLSAQVLTVRGEKVILSTFVDITERKKAEADILKLSEDMAARNLELETVNKELESFVYSVSHDLRAPLRSVSGFAKILVEDYIDKLDAQASDYLARIYNGSEKMSQRIEALMHLTKISRQGLERVEVNLSRVTSTLIFDLRQANPSRNVEVVIAEGLTASADLNLLKVALSNLFENAWKFTSKTENARIEFGAVDNALRIAECGLRNETLAEQVKQGKRVYYVRDNGAGFDPHYADRMFWPFHRLHTDQEFEGTGIGLAIVERVVRRHGGKVWAEGEPGKGATFYFTL
jgi:PAS domain S-box-containing protein